MAFQSLELLNKCKEADYCGVDAGHFNCLPSITAGLLQVDEPEVWSELGHSQLADNRVADAIESYLRSGDYSRHAEVISRSKEAGAHAQLVKFLLMVRKKIKDPTVCLTQPLEE